VASIKKLALLRAPACPILKIQEIDDEPSHEMFDLCFGLFSDKPSCPSY
jgi:hypothetical protein